MHKQELFVLGVISMASLLLIFAVGHRALTGMLVNSYEPFDVQPTLLPVPPYQYPSFIWPSTLSPLANMQGFPTKEMLKPSLLVFFVDQIPIPGTNFNFVPLQDSRIHTYSGIVGYYDEDPTDSIQGYLCSFAYKVINAPLRCERVPLAYNADGTVSFARGYAPGEYIAYQAMGTDFGAVFVVANPQYGILASSPIALLRWVSD